MSLTDSGSDHGSSWLSDRWPVILLSVCWAVVAYWINPERNVPLNDDWSYALSVEALLRTHTLRLTDWQSATLVVQLFWGALFCLFFGFSITVLHLSTLTLSVAGIFGLHGLLRHLGGDRRVATLGAAVLAFNPYYIHLSHSFMTDIAGLTLMVWSMLLLLRGLDSDRNGEIAAGLIVALLATFVRQLGLMVFIAFAVAYPIRRGFDRRWLLLAVLPTILAAGALSAFERFLIHIGELPGLYHAKSKDVKAVIGDLLHFRLGALRNPIYVTFQLLIYVGLACLPFSLMMVSSALGRFTPSGRKLALGGVIAFTVALTFGLSLVGKIMPIASNLLNDPGLGLRSLPGILPPAPRAYWMVWTALAVLGMSLTLPILFAYARDLWLRRAEITQPESEQEAEGRFQLWHLVFLAIVTVLCYGPMAFSYAPFFDRYTLVFLPLLLAILVSLGAGRPACMSFPCGWMGLAILLAFAGFGIVATRDYLAWNQIRWEAAERFQKERGLAPEEIDAGFEYNNFHASRARIQGEWIHKPGDDGLVNRSSLRNRLAFQPLPDHEIVSEVECHPWLPFGIKRIYLLTRKADTSASPKPEPSAPAAAEGR